MTTGDHHRTTVYFVELTSFKVEEMIVFPVTSRNPVAYNLTLLTASDKKHSRTPG